MTNKKIVRFFTEKADYHKIFMYVSVSVIVIGMFIATFIREGLFPGTIIVGAGAVGAFINEMVTASGKGVYQDTQEALLSESKRFGDMLEKSDGRPEYIINCGYVFGDGIKCKQAIKGKAVSPCGEVCALSRDKKTGGINAYKTSFDFMTGEKGSEEISGKATEVVAKCREISFKYFGISDNRIEVELMSGERTVSLFFADDYQSRQFLKELFGERVLEE